jgi:hypothetical protein
MAQDILPDEVWEQEVADGGVVGGELPAAAAAVVVQGVSAVREVPALAGTFGKLTITNGSALRIGRNPRRRRLLLSVRPNTTATAYATLGETQQQAASDYGPSALQGTNFAAMQYAGELWVAAFGADVTVGFFAELDQG